MDRVLHVAGPAIRAVDRKDGARLTEAVDRLRGRYNAAGGDIWELLWNPRPLVGVNINTVGDTTAFYTGLDWAWDAWGPVFVSLDLGGAVHDGEPTTTEIDRKELGPRVLFGEALEIGYRFLDRHALSIRLDHISNAGLTDNNEGLDTLGVVYGYRY